MKKTVLLLVIIVCNFTLFADIIDSVGYKELYENQKEYNSNIITLVVTVFAIACGLVIALQAVSWYTEHNRYKKFVEEIRKQVTDEMNQMHIEMKDNLDKRLNALVEGKFSLLSTNLVHLKTEVGEIKDSTNHLEEKIERITINKGS